MHATPPDEDTALTGEHSPLFAPNLASFGDRSAVVTEGTTITYAQLDERVEELTERLGPERRLLLLEATNSLDSLVGYLAALRARHPLLLSGPDPASLRRITST